MDTKSLRGIASSLRIVVGVVTLGAAALAQGIPAPDGLYLRFNEGAGTTTANDAVPGTLAPAVLTNVAGWVASPNVPYLGASAFDPTPAALPVPPILTTNATYTFAPSWTIEFAVDLLANPANNNSTTIINDSFVNLDISVFRNGGASWVVQGTFPLLGAFIGVTSIVSNPINPTSNWTFISIVYDQPAGALRLYVDGVLDVTTPVPAPTSIFISSTNPAGISIGGNPFVLPPVAPLLQPIDELRIWNSARTQAEIAANVFNEVIPLVRGIEMANGATLVLNTQNSTFTVSGTVAGVRLVGGSLQTTPSFDPVIGAPVTIVGSYIGADLARLSDFVFTPTTISLQGAIPSDSLVISGIFASAFGAGTYFEFGGSLGAFPAPRRAVASPNAPSVVRTGGGSTVLDGFASRMSAGSALSILLEATGGNPVLRAFELDFVLPVVSQPRRVAATNGAGSFELGILGSSPASRVFNLFALSPTTPVGTGGFFGLEVSAFLLVQLNLPFPSTPFRVPTDAEGNYFFGVPSGTLPAGLAADEVTIVLSPSGQTIDYASPSVRLVF